MKRDILADCEIMGCRSKLERQVKFLWQFFEASVDGFAAVGVKVELIVLCMVLNNHESINVDWKMWVDKPQKWCDLDWGISCWKWCSLCFFSYQAWHLCASENRRTSIENDKLTHPTNGFHVSSTLQRHRATIHLNYEHIFNISQRIPFNQSPYGNCGYGYALQRSLPFEFFNIAQRKHSPPRIRIGIRGWIARMALYTSGPTNSKRHQMQWIRKGTNVFLQLSSAIGIWLIQRHESSKRRCTQINWD